MRSAVLPGLFSDDPAPQSVTMAPSAREARRSGLRVARTKAPKQMLEYLSALKQCGPASDHEMARVLCWELSVVNARRNDAGSQVEARGRVSVTHLDGKRSSRTLWAVAGER